MGESNVGKARRVAGISQSKCAEILGVSMPTYIKYEHDPTAMTFGQFFTLAEEMDSEAREFMQKALADAECDSQQWKPLEELTLGEFYASRNCVEQLKRQLYRMEEKVFA